MGKKPPLHMVKHGDGWTSRREGAARVSRTFNTKAEAQAAGSAGRAPARDRPHHPQGRRHDRRAQQLRQRPPPAKLVSLGLATR